MATKKNVDIFICETCGKMYLNERAAENCCAPYHCSVCGKETPRYILKCNSCSSKEKYEAARKLTLEEYEKEFPGCMLYDGNDYFADMEELIDHYQYNDSPIPNYVYGTFRVYGEIDPDEVLEGIEQELDCEDLAFDKEAYEEFRAFAKQWNEKHKIYCYYSDEKVVVLISPDILEENNHD